MSMDFVIIGRLVKDCASKMTQSGKMIHTFTVASNRGFGEKQETDFFDCMAFAPKLDKQADFLLQGCMVKVKGHIQTKKVKDEQTGKTQTYWSCLVEEVEMLWSKKKGEQVQGSVKVNPDNLPENFTDEDDDVIPF